MAHGIYIHTPFCATKCPYCDFYSGVFASHQVDSWVAALEREMRGRAGEVPPPPAASVFIGGGTPSHLPQAVLERVFTALHEHFRIATDAEITVECNPESLTPEQAAHLLDLGVNRVSIGVQSLDDSVLERLGRPHDAAMAWRAAALARDTFERVSFDLIVAVPGMTTAVLDRTLGRLLELRPDHVSAYNLTIESGTVFATERDRGTLVEMSDDAALELDARVGERTAAAGLARYEVSNYARPGAECRHNLDIWRGGYYMGLGPGAHAYLPDAASPYGRRSSTIRDLATYVASWRAGKPAPASVERIQGRTYVEERLMLGLRLREGLELDRLARMVGAPPPLVDREVLADLEAAGFLEQAGSAWRTTPAGRRVLDSVIARLAAAIRPGSWQDAPRGPQLTPAGGFV